MKLFSGDLPPVLIDNTLRAPVWTYLLCIVLRVSMGLVLLLSKWHLLHQIIMVVLLFPLLGLGFKFYKLGLHIWKDYARHLILIGIAVLLLALSFRQHNDWLVKPAGLLVILDAVMGWQTRFITSNMWYVMTTSKK